MSVVTMHPPGRGVGSDANAKDNELCRFDLDGGRKIQRCLNILVDDAGNMASAGYIATTGVMYASAFDTNVAAAGVTLSGTALAADGTDANIDVDITPKGTGTVHITGSIKMVDGNQGAGKVLTSDGDGVATWQAAAGGGDFSNGGEAGGADRTLGNTDNYDFGFLTNNLNRLQIQNDGYIGVNVIDPCSLFEIKDTTAHPVLTITAAHATDHDPQLQLRTDATPTVKCSLGVDARDDSFRINMGSGVGDSTQFAIDANGNIKYMKADPYLNSDTNFILGVDAGGAGNLEHTAGTEGWYNAILGSGAGYSLTTGFYNTMIGDGAGYYTDIGFGNTFIGRWAGHYNEDGNYNFFMGRNAGRSNIGGSSNFFMGDSSGYSNVSGIGNITIANSSLYYNQTGHNNIVFGAQAATGVSGGQITGNILFGRRAGRYIGNGSNYNISIGFDSGEELGAGALGNIILGYQAGNNLTTGSNNLLIGYDIDAPSATADGQLSIGNLIFGTGLDGTGTTVSSGNIGIAEPAPETILEIKHASPILQLKNSTEENTEGGRESIWRAKGHKLDSTPTTLGQAQFSHDGTGNDYLADFILSLNANAGADTLTERMRIASDGIMSVEGNIYPMTDDSYYLGRNDDDSPLAWKGIIFADTADGKYYRLESTNGVATMTDLTD